MIKNFEKPCKRNRCPFYTKREWFKKCEKCDWNPESMWEVRKKVQE